MAFTKREEAELKLLSLANEKRKFAIQVGYVYDDKASIEAFERGIDEQWFTLVDVTPIGSVLDDRVMRVFRLTDLGLEHLARLKRWQEKGVPWA